MSKEKKTYFQGSYDKNFERVKRNQIMLGNSFSVTSSTGRVFLDNGLIKYVFTKYPKDDDFQKTVFLIGLVRGNIDKYYEKNGHNFYWNKEHVVKLMNVKNCNNYKGKMLHCIDVRACYYTTLYNLGFITERTYKRGMRPEEYDLFKPARLLSAGTLNKNLYTEFFNSKGEVTGEFYHTDYKEKYMPFYQAIVSRIDKMLYELMVLDGFCMWITDCVYCYCTTEYLKKYIDVFKKYQYEYKRFTSCITEVESNIKNKTKSVTWWDDSKNKQKGEIFILSETTNN